jgi:hypothetical protein
MNSNNNREFYFDLDDWVKIKDYHKTKFQFHWKGPYNIHGFRYFPTYWLRETKGEVLKTLINQANLAPWTARLAENEDFFHGFAINDENVEENSEEEDVVEAFQRGG